MSCRDARNNAQNEYSFDRLSLFYFTSRHQKMQTKQQEIGTIGNSAIGSRSNSTRLIHPIGRALPVRMILCYNALGHADVAEELSMGRQARGQAGAQLPIHHLSGQAKVPEQV
jgi:hypothetical protein